MTHLEQPHSLCTRACLRQTQWFHQIHFRWVISTRMSATMAMNRNSRVTLEAFQSVSGSAMGHSAQWGRRGA